MLYNESKSKQGCNLIAMTTTSFEPGVARRLRTEIPKLDENLPVWARRSNPIIRRQLGIYWRVFIPQLDFLSRWYLYQAVIILLTAQFDFLFAPVLMLVLASFMLLPIAFYMYAKMLSEIVVDSVTAITDEFKNETLMLLRVTPFSAQHIILSKVAGAFWRQMESLDGVLTMALFLGTPVIVFQQVLAYSPEDHFLLPQTISVAVMLVSLVRLPLEMFMIGMIGMVSGTATRNRSMGIIVASVFTFFYFLLLNLPRLVDLPLILYLLVEVVLPLMLPIYIIWGGLRATLAMLLRD